MQQHHQEYKISGVSVLFPCKPYPSQFSMMDKIIKGIERRQNCLIESPTGSGKSLALLCSTLAWQFAERAKQALAETEEQEKGVCTCSHDKGSVSSSNTTTPETALEKQLTDLSSNKWTTDLPVSDCPHDVDDDFKSVGKNLKNLPTAKDSKKHVSIAYESDQEMTTPTANRKQADAATCAQKTDQNESPSTTCTCDASTTEKRPRIKIPKIYFGTRTHKQVAQIVRELKKTDYHDVRMSILGSREHTCIHPQVSRAKNKTEECKELLNDKGCHFKDGTPRLTSQTVIKGLGLDTAWDLEDLVSFCKTKRACAYFLSRGLKDESDLIICPYNYLVDPMVREAMQISLKGHVVILDEAHNIEDSAREAASQSMTQENILKGIKDIESLMEANVNLADHSKLRCVLKNLDTFIEANKTKLEQKDWDKSYKVWTGYQLVAQLETLGLGPKLFPEYKKSLAAVRADVEQQKEESLESRRDQDIMEMKQSTQTILEQVFQVLDYLYRLDLKYVDDYRASLFQSQNNMLASYDGQWLNSKSINGGRPYVQVDTYTLNFWCMNPGVAFSDFSETRSIILTSGTLSPMTSFESELGLEFKIQLEANHVIEDSQVWVGTLGQGPSGSTLQAVFRNVETFAFQDELGSLVLRVCEVVPHGVLCFLPSYNVLDKLINRWQSTGLKNKLEQLKLVIREPKNSDKLNFDDQLKMFYEAMTPQPDSNVKADTDGAVFFAVCRGKVSEGLDFADNFARAVITVGVPYPNFKDVQVELKRKYNDQHHQARGLLPGHEWYEVQAFRALNQALGRCIRHRHDWGALIIVDDRFVKTASKYCKGLSKWMRNKIQTFRDFGVAMESLSKFTARQVALKEDFDSLDTSHNSDQFPQTPHNKSNRVPTWGQAATSPDVLKPTEVYSIFKSSSTLRATPKICNNRSKSTDSRFPVSNGPGSHQKNNHLANGPGRSLIPALTGPGSHQKNNHLANGPGRSLIPALTGPGSHQKNNHLANGPGRSLIPALTGPGSHQKNNHLANGPARSLIPALTAKAQQTFPANISSPSLAGQTSRPVHSSWQVLQTAADTNIIEDQYQNASVNMKSQIPEDIKATLTHELSVSGSTLKESSSSNCGTETSVSFTNQSCSSDHFQDSVTSNTNQTALIVKATHLSHRLSITEGDLHPATVHTHNHATKLVNGDLNSFSNTSHHVLGRTLEQHPEIVQISAQLIDESLLDFPPATASKNGSSDPRWCKITSTLNGTSVCEKGVRNYQEMTVDTENNPVAPIGRECIMVAPTATQCVSLEASSLQTNKRTCPPLNAELSTATECVSLEASSLHTNKRTCPPLNAELSTATECVSLEASRLQTNKRTCPPLNAELSTVTECVSLDASSLQTNKRTCPPLNAELSTTPQADNPEIIPASPDFKNICTNATKQTFSNKKYLFKSTPLRSRGPSVPAESDQPTADNRPTADTNCSAKRGLLLSGISSQKRSTSCSSPSGVRGDSSQGNEDTLVVRRKVRGTKRRHLSRTSCEERQKEEQEDHSCQKQAAKVVITCSACGHVLTENVQQSEFQELRCVPSFLKEAEKMDHMGSLFFPGRTDRVDLQGISECKTGPNTKYVEQEDICVQFLYCGMCLTASTLTPPAVGAQVKLAAGSGARFSKGQVWLFLSAVSQTTKP